MPRAQTHPRTINPQLIDSIAAEVFWGYSFRTDHQTAVTCVLEGDFARMWTLKDAQSILREYDRRIAHDTVRQCYAETNAYMMDKARQEENIIGRLYVEDFTRCRPPLFAHDNLLRELRSRGDAEGEIKGSPPVAGDLLIRTPLPAVLLLKERPSSAWIQPLSTGKALGFHKTLTLMVRGAGPLPSNSQGYGWCATGVFTIRCGRETARLWLKLIPNSAACRELVPRCRPPPSLPRAADDA